MVFSVLFSALFMECFPQYYTQQWRESAYRKPPSPPPQPGTFLMTQRIFAYVPCQGLPDGPVAKTLNSQCRGPGSDFLMGS